MSIHVAIVSDQTLANLIPAFMLRPQKVYLVTSREMAGKGLDRRIQDRLRDRGIESEVVADAPDTGLVALSAYANRVAGGIRVRHPGLAIALNATGGTKPMMLAFVDAFRSVGAQVLYTDTRHRLIEFLPEAGHKEGVTVPMVSVLDVPAYLAAQGFVFESAVSDDERWLQRAEARADAADFLAREAVILADFIGAMSFLASEARDNDGQLRQPRQCHKRKPAGHWGHAMDVLAKAGLVAWDGSAEFEFSSAEAAAFIGGIWLEEYAWRTIRECKPHDVRISVRGNWDRGARAANEFDVLATYLNQILFVECKTLRLGRDGAKDSDILYKVDSLGQDVRGLFGSTWLISGREPTPAVLDRANAQGVTIIGPGKLPNLAVAVRRWMTTGA
jgi:hypothetical protein